MAFEQHSLGRDSINDSAVILNSSMIAAMFVRLIVWLQLVVICSCCQNDEHPFDLDSQPWNTLTIRPGRSVSLVCRGAKFHRKQWTVTHGSAINLMVYSSRGGQPAIRTVCHEDDHCQPLGRPVAELTCSGERISPTIESKLHVHLYLECNIPAVSSHNKTVPRNASRSDTLKDATRAKNQDFHGLIIGFGVCVALAMLSSLIVFMHRKCAKIQLKSCFCLSGSTSTYPSSAKDAGDGSQKPQFMHLMRGGNIHMAQLQKKRVMGNAQTSEF